MEIKFKTCMWCWFIATKWIKLCSLKGISIDIGIFIEYWQFMILCMVLSQSIEFIFFIWRWFSCFFLISTIIHTMANQNDALALSSVFSEVFNDSFQWINVFSYEKKEQYWINKSNFGKTSIESNLNALNLYLSSTMSIFFLNYAKIFEWKTNRWIFFWNVIRLKLFSNYTNESIFSLKNYSNKLPNWRWE